MKISALKLVLQNFDDALRSLGPKGPVELQEFQSLLAGQKDGPVTKLATELKRKLLSQCGVMSEPVERLRTQLELLGNVLYSAGAKSPANEIRKVSDALCGDFRSVAELVEYVLRQSAVSPSKRAAVAVSHELVQSYLEALRGSQADNAEFDRNISLLRADNRIRKEEMREIAKQYLGFEIAKKKGREPALKEIINFQALNARQNARIGSHSVL